MKCVGLDSVVIFCGCSKSEKKEGGWPQSNDVDNEDQQMLDYIFIQ